ncbi:hypothetical protein RD055328_08410 [Companilactobacillus sp. RD055328]|uniref:DUF4355 domain-containing protein n=1 Tax=Companilactobacillus sp. RD055328 TaxID=2916634 RepID=UPI001FC80D4B|nr:DUF4355 domain-containing protein [Companilactobacillus sp. RD055328]GKQ42918.1 hypothetical protein RD055328_08410 [Companilactobacillus sp. RD055328]
MSEETKVDEVQVEENPTNEDVEQVENLQQNDEQKSDYKYTDSDVDDIVQKRLAKEKAKFEKQKDEAQKLAKMNADQKKEYELEKVQKERDEANAKLAKFEMNKVARSMFNEAKIDVSDDTLDLVVTSDADSTKENVSKFLAFTESYKEAITKDLTSGITPRINGNSNEKPLSPFEKKLNKYK